MRSKDRLAELRRAAESAAVYRDTVELAAEPSAHHADIDAIFQEVERMRSWIDEMNGNTQLMRRLHADPTFHTNKHNVQADTAAARLALRAAEARREELARLESALRDVRSLFAQLAHLVAAQQERVDSVEYYALQATEHVETGQHQLLKGTVSRTKQRKKKMSLFICLSAGFLLVLLVLVFT